MRLKLLHTTGLGALGFLFVCVTLSLAASLLWLAELIEEHTRTAKIVGRRIIYAVIVFHGLLYITEDHFPLKQIAFSIICHFTYLSNFQTFPVISLTSVSFISSCILAVLNHFLWFFHFNGLAQAARARESKWRYRHSTAPKLEVPSFLDVSTFFAICVWLVPLFLFLSLSANENTLPVSQGQNGPAPSSQVDESKQRHSLFMSLFSSLVSFLPRGLSRRPPAREGIIPHSISPPPSPHGTKLFSPIENTFPVGSQNTLLSPSSPSLSRQASPTRDSWVSVESTQDATLINSPTIGSSTTRKRFILDPPPKRNQ